jgi:hypothetical protein
LERYVDVVIAFLIKSVLYCMYMMMRDEQLIVPLLPRPSPLYLAYVINIILGLQFGHVKNDDIASVVNYLWSIFTPK